MRHLTGWTRRNGCGFRLAARTYVTLPGSDRRDTHFRRRNGTLTLQSTGQRDETHCPPAAQSHTLGFRRPGRPPRASELRPNMSAAPHAIAMGYVPVSHHATDAGISGSVRNWWGPAPKAKSVPYYKPLPPRREQREARAAGGAGRPHNWCSPVFSSSDLPALVPENTAGHRSRRTCPSVWPGA